MKFVAFDLDFGQCHIVMNSDHILSIESRTVNGETVVILTTSLGKEYELNEDMSYAHEILSVQVGRL